MRRGHAAVSAASLVASREAVLFDLDGVLLLSSAAHEAAFAEVCAERGLLMPPYAALMGMRTDEAFELIVQDQDDPDRWRAALPALVEEKRDRARALLRAAPPVAPECLEVVSALAERSRLALVSSSSRQNVELFLEVSGTRRCWSSVVDGGRAARAKPAPDLFELALDELGVESADAVVIEDSPAGVQAAVRAGVDCVGVVGGLDAAALRAEGALAVIGGLEELTS